MKWIFKNKKISILLSSFIFLLCLVQIFKANYHLNHSSDIKLRNLLNQYDKNVIIGRCEKGDKNFLDKYNEVEEPLEEQKNLTKYQIALKESIETENWKKLRKYLPRILIFSIIIILDIIFIFVWLFSAFCCCYGKKNKETLGCCGKCTLFIGVIFCILVIAICLFGLFYSFQFYKTINNIDCSIYKLIFHFTDGTDSDYPSNNWVGYEGISDYMLNLERCERRIKKYNESINSFDGGDTQTQNIFNKIQSIVNNVVDINNYLIKELANNGKVIDDISEIFNEKKVDILYDIEDSTFYIDKYYKIGFILLFCLTLGFCFLQMIIVLIYFLTKCDCILCLFHLFWNLEMILIIVGIFIGACMGITGIVITDFVSLLQYAKSSKNIESETPLFFDKINSGGIEGLKICFNGDGNLMKILDFDFSFGTKLNESYNKYQELLKNIEPQLEINKDLSDNIKGFGSELLYLQNKYEELSDENLHNMFNCTFVKNDFNILFNELKKNAAPKLLFIAILLIVADIFAIISSQAGVHLVKNYKGNDTEELVVPKDKNKGRVHGSNNKMDISSEQLRH